MRSGRLAQLVEHLVYTERVGGSSPSPPTEPSRRGGGAAVFAICGLLAATAGVRAQAAPAIACARNRTAVERDICAAPELLAMDREITALYDRALAQTPRDEHHRLAQGQLAYLKSRGGCGWAAHNSAHPGTAVEECVRGAMDGRVHALRHLVDRTGE
jgi:uncharacterized protein YecT (DUF1311 family)